MKHSADFPFARALPDAPLDMPKQLLERRSLFDMLRITLSVLTGR
ncbi:MAG: hypothetical protein P0Y65_05245 [Candidatus Devosia phytovorans]|uniref:Uncharacterized protein n=1 Tax=Candidatus Devosia phytovorans TaxID=3121372 RepID=A0AAJ6B0W9_9HYPH|nr:hypothetical protein [Devosia sp.]WEK05662.1 MAG: hypothetical protein P0Y65_05245 [Devosia sp.]